ncbi:MAG: hypothetical protein DCC55_16255 [Chloroflexi bacterium]|nr:MAG: hypothetical protein DCC55_16255 [Chloroflexota bacterium]
MTAKTVVIEWAPFELVAGTAEEVLMQASEVLQKEFLARQPGFIRRELLRGRDNQWVDLVYWESMEDAVQAAQNAANSPVCYAYFQLMVAADHDDPAAGVLHFDQMRSYYPQEFVIAS